MTTADRIDLAAGRHWLNRLAEELGTDATRHIDELDAWDLSPGDIALAIMEACTPLGTVQAAKIHVRCWPWEKARLIRAAQGEKLEEFCRKALIRAAMEADGEN